MTWHWRLMLSTGMWGLLVPIMMAIGEGCCPCLKELSLDDSYMTAADGAAMAHALSSGHSQLGLEVLRLDHILPNRDTSLHLATACDWTTRRAAI